MNESTNGRDVFPGELAAALGLARSTFVRAIEAGHIPEPTSHTPGGHRRWAMPEAVAIVRAAKRKVPGDWEVGQPPTSAGSEAP